MIYIMNTKKKLKLVGVSKSCIDCGCYIPKDCKRIFLTYRENPDWKEGEPKSNLYDQCMDCGYNKFL